VKPANGSGASAGAPTVRVELVILASPSAVWDVLVDFPRYPEWNPFTVGVQTSGRVGDPVLLDVQLGERRLSMRERMRVYEPGRRIGWGLRILGGTLLDCTRVQELEDLGDGRTRYVCHESFRGLLVPLFFNRYRGAMERGFTAAGESLARRVTSSSRHGSTGSTGSTE
jgi:hypothetical protein